ncbi:S8 family serine peptidase [Actinoplanes sp. NPDC024001]|uniref:S8 family serine peptidase n=1 Tax=Actinoplanes sp. NPDC024001 TaxID=3154598 RepID=UPI003407EEDA
MKSSHRRITVGLVTAGLAASLGAFGVADAADTTSLPVRLIVGLKAGVDANAGLSGADRFGVRDLMARRSQMSRDLGNALGAKSMEVAGTRVASAIAALRSDPNVAYVEVDGQSKAFDVAPNDPVFSGGYQPELRQLNVPKAWDTTTGAGVKVAVLDTGVSPVGDLAGKVLPGYDFYHYDNDANDNDAGAFRHGTVVASLIAATPNNGAGMAGVCGGCQILPVKVLGGKNGIGYNYDIAQGIIYAVQQGAKIINMSLGGPSRSTAIQNAVAYANGRGVLVVAAAGNEGEDGNPVNYPAAYSDVLSVAATNTRTGGTALTSWSSYGAGWVDVAAPGITAGMWSNGKYCWDGNTAACGGHTLQGTSFAAPLVSGVAALIASRKPNYQGWSLQNSILASTRKITNRVKYGLVDANAALFKSTDTVPPTVTGMTPRQNAAVRGTVAVVPTGMTDAKSGIRAVELYVDGKHHSVDYASPWAPTLKTTGRNGAIKLQLRVTDKAGNRTWSPSRVVIADNVLPSVSITKGPKNKAKVKGTVTIKVKASDRSGISKVQLLVNGKVVATDTTAGYSLKFKVSKQKKKMKVRVRAYDKAGNVRYVTTRTYYRA